MRVIEFLARLIALEPGAAPAAAHEAIDLAKKAVAAKPGDRGFANTLALAYLRAGELPQAANAFKKSLAVPTPGGDGLEQILMALVCCRRGKKEAAVDWYIKGNETIARNPRTSPAALALKSEAGRILKRPANWKPASASKLVSSTVPLEHRLQEPKTAGASSKAFEVWLFPRRWSQRVGQQRS
jgi:tetratricopeptide (TPR) repeat protein